jgi:hypothetical protein
LILITHPDFQGNPTLSGYARRAGLRSCGLSVADAAKASLGTVLRILLLWLIMMVPAFANDSRPTTIYFYNPEINLDRDLVLKSRFDAFLVEFGSYQFQPVSNKSTFEQLVLAERNAVFMMSSWHYQALSASADIAVKLVGMRNGSTIYRKILVSSLDREALVTQKGLTIASSGTHDYTLSIIRQIFARQPEAFFDRLNILVVPKDMDALMSVGFGMADAALGTQSSLDKLSILYKQQTGNLKPVGESGELTRLVTVVPREADQRSNELVEIIAQMKLTPEGKQQLLMLGLDDWQRVDGFITRQTRELHR